MPDMERLTRKFHIAHADKIGGENERRVVEAYYHGVDRARKEIAWIVLGAAALAVISAWIFG